MKLRKPRTLRSRRHIGKKLVYRAVSRIDFAALAADKAFASSKEQKAECPDGNH